MNKYLIILLLLCLAGSVLYSKWAREHALKRLYDIRMQRDKERFMKAVDSDFVRIHFSELSRVIMKLNYCIEEGFTGEVYDLLNQVRSIPCKPAQKDELYGKLYHYAKGKGDEDLAAVCENEVRRLLRGEK